MKKELFKILSVVCFMLPVTGITHAQEEMRPMLLYFRIDCAAVERDYMDNARTLEAFHRIFSDSALASRIDTVIVTSYASPDGDESYNLRLARQRSVAVKGYLVWKYPHLNQYRIAVRPQGENWQGLRSLIAADYAVPHQKEVLQILNKNTDSRLCKEQLRRLDGGISYTYIREHILHNLRHASVCTVRLKDPLPLLDRTDIFRPDITRTNELYRGSLRTEVSPVYPLPVSSSTIKRPLFALKTNLLFDAALMPNIEIEVPVNKRWSLNGELMFPWWLLDGDRYCMQILAGGLEGRYWLGSHRNRENRKILTGHFLGLYAGGGKYDLQWQEKGYQGEFFIAAGISYGYAVSIAKHFRLEFNLGIGLLRTNYEFYHARDNYQTLLWQNSGTYTWFGPTKAKISLVWLLNRKIKKGGAK